MFICKKALFDQYAEWLFDVLFECEKYIKPSPYTRGRRTLAYMGEFLLPVYLMYHQCRVESVRYTDGHGHSKPHNGIKHKVAYNLVQWLTMKPCQYWLLNYLTSGVMPNALLGIWDR